ncbi:hypothetical protein Tco_0237054, partial [Tanacetum coccineum]
IGAIDGLDGTERGYQRPSHLGRNEDDQPLRSSLTYVHRGRQSSINTGGNLPPNGTLLSHHAQPFIPNSVLVPTHITPYSQPSTGIINGQTPSFLFPAQTDNPSVEGASAYPPQGGYVPQTFLNGNIPLYNGSTYPVPTPTNKYPFHTQPMYAQLNMPVCPNSYPVGLFADPTGSVTPFVCWIEEYPLLDALKMPFHVGTYDGKGDPDNFLHLFEGAIHMQKWLIQQRRFTKTHLAVHNIKQREGESVRAFATRYTNDTLQILGLPEDQRIFGFVHVLKARNLVEHLSTDLPSTYKGLIEKTYTWIEVREVATNGAPNDRRDNSERSRKSSRDNGRGQRSRDRFSPCRGPNHGLLSSLSKSPREILATEKVARSFEQPPCMLGSRRSRDMSKFCYFHEDHGHDTNDCRQLRSQIKEAVRSGQLSHLVKGIKKERTKTFDSQLGEKKEKSTTPAKAPILMINQGEACTRNNISKSPTFKGREIKFPPVTKDRNSSAQVIIKAKIFEREVGRVHMNSGSSCEVIYEHYFLKLKPSIQAFKVDSQVLLVGFSGESPRPLEKFFWRSR